MGKRERIIRRSIFGIVFPVATAILLSATAVRAQDTEATSPIEKPQIHVKSLQQDGDAAETSTLAETCAVPSNQQPAKSSQANSEVDLKSKSIAKPLTPDLPTIGLLIYDHVLQTEITAPSDVFSKPSKDGKQMFNVITIAASYDLITTEEGLRIFPDYTFENAPKLDVIVVPSAYDMSARVNDTQLVKFIQSQNKNTQYTVSNCGGASLIGEAGIAQGKKIVTWIGGGDELQKKYPQLKVQDDASVSYVEDGKFLSSNGNLASYISSLELLEKMTSKEHVDFVKSYLYLNRLQNWKQ